MDKLTFNIPGTWAMGIPQFVDSRGELCKVLDEDIGFKVKEVYMANTKAGYLRGLHFQAPPYPQNKIICCTQGMIQDVVVDLRKGSPTYGESVTYYFDEAGPYIFHIPAGCAHGYYACQDSQVMYLMDETFHEECYGGIRWDSIYNVWPDGVRTSDKDAGLPKLVDYDSPFIYGVNC